MSGRRIELSATQVTASVLAAVTGAVAASYLGVAGTIIGAAVVSFASTAGTVVYRHYLGQTQEKLRAAAAQLPHAGARTGSGRPAVPGSPVQVTVPQRAGPVRYHLASEELALRPAGDPAIRDEDLATTTAGDRAAWGTDPEPPARAEPAGTAKTAKAAVAGGLASRNAAARPGRARWLVWAAAAAGIFLVTMAGITVFEAATGRPLDAIVWNRHNSGTTIGNAVTGHTGPRGGGGRPASTPSQRSSAPATPSAAPSSAPSASPTSAPATSTPSPGGSANPSPGTSAGAG